MKYLPSLLVGSHMEHNRGHSSQTKEFTNIQCLGIIRRYLSLEEDLN